MVRFGLVAIYHCYRERLFIAFFVMADDLYPTDVETGLGCFIPVCLLSPISDVWGLSESSFSGTLLLSFVSLSGIIFMQCGNYFSRFRDDTPLHRGLVGYVLTMNTWVFGNQHARQ